MARLAKVVSNEKREKLAKRYAKLRKELKAKIVDPKVSEDERFEAMIRLQKLPKNSSPVRVRNRCAVTGRPRGFYRDFKLSRLEFRRLALKGMIPGVTKSSW
ncbi:MAG: 30S ribosomal protein S14 [Bacteriovoracaceae bacterium]